MLIVVIRLVTSAGTHIVSGAPVATLLSTVTLHVFSSMTKFSARLTISDCMGPNVPNVVIPSHSQTGSEELMTRSVAMS